jgi:type IV secretory pathway TraG/TraD family ATPase VirD4
MECKLKKLFTPFKKEPYTVIGKGFALSDDKRRKLVDIILLDKNRTGHMFMFATTRVGKTRLVESMTEQDIIKGNNVVVIDPKVDFELFSKIYQTALRIGREDDLMLLSPIFPEYSIHINPLSHWYMPEEPIAHIMAGVPAEDEFFYNVALETTTFIVRSLLIIKKFDHDESPLCFEDVASLAYYKGIVDLKDKLVGIKDPEQPKLLNLAEQVLQSPQDYFSKVSSTLRTTLTQMTIGSIGNIIGNATKNEFIDRIEKGKGVILYVQTGSMLTKKTADILGKVIVSMIQSVAGRFYASGMKFHNPLCLYIDEMSNCVYRGIEDAFNKGGGADLRIVGLTQSMADIVTEIGEDRARKLFDNTNTKIFGRVNDIASAKIVAEYGGLVNRHVSMFNSDGNITAREVEEEIIKVEETMRLNPREIFYFGFEGQFRGKTAPVHPSEIMVKPPRIIKDNEEVSYL